MDTSAKDVKAVIQLYENYYQSQPDSVYNNPYWNEAEKARYKDFDFSRVSIFQGGMNANTLFQYFSPFVLSVEPIGEKYQIRVLFSSSTTDPKYAGSKVWCIQKLNAIKENGKWVLENLLVELSKNWHIKKQGCITYVYPPNHNFNASSAQQAEDFCNSIIERFNPSYSDSFHYYVTSSIDDMGLLENFDYYFVGITTGKAREGMILTAKGNEFYTHEFVHKLIPENPKRGYVIEEGIAAFLGTKQDSGEYNNLMAFLSTDLQLSPKKINFQSVVSQSIRFHGYQTAYPAGAAICEVIHQLKGDEGLKQLLLADTSSYEKLVSAVCSITELNSNELEKKWLEVLKGFK